jgi:hypothetical protein
MLQRSKEDRVQRFPIWLLQNLKFPHLDEARMAAGIISGQHPDSYERR